MLNSPEFSPHRFCVAPMLDWTDKHARFFHRQLSQCALLYTEMVTTHAIIHGDSERFLAFNPEEHPVALQLGGSNPSELAEACRIANRFGYDEINLNVGCPSDRVQSGQFGACLMKNPDRVADCFKAMQDASTERITIKCRTGVDEFEDFDFLLHFIETQMEAGCRVFIVHARKAWLQGLSPKQNREIPPLEYSKVYRLKHLFPEATFVINGGVKSLAACLEHLEQLDGVMMGREAYQNPYLLARVDQALFDSDTPPVTRDAVIRKMMEYIANQMAQGVKLQMITRHILGLYHGMPGARVFRRTISEQAHKKAADITVIERALAAMVECQSIMENKDG